MLSHSSLLHADTIIGPWGYFLSILNALNKVTVNFHPNRKGLNIVCGRTLYKSN